METLQDEEKKILTQSRKRIQHLEDLYKIPSLADVKYEEWSRIRLNRLLVDHMLRSGYSESARQLAAEKGIEDLVDLSVFVQCQRIAESLGRGETKEALTWCGENKMGLKKVQVCFHLFSFGCCGKVTWMNLRVTADFGRAILSSSYGYNSILRW